MPVWEDIKQLVSVESIQQQHLKRCVRELILKARQHDFHSVRSDFKDLIRDVSAILREKASQAWPILAQMQREARFLASYWLLRSLTFFHQNTLLCCTGLIAFCSGFVMARLFFPCYTFQSPLKPRKMRAIVTDASQPRYDEDDFSDLNVSLVMDVLLPRVTSPEEVLIKVMSAAIDPVDVSLIIEHDNPANLVLGRDFSGEVLEVGHLVSHVSVGDRVWSALSASRSGCLCEYLVLPGSLVRLAPTNLSHEDACMLPYSGLIVWSSLSNLSLRGCRALVVDGTSCTGCIAIQLLKYFEASITTCVNYRQAALANKLGADSIIAITAADLDPEDKCRHEWSDWEPFDLVVMTLRDADSTLSEAFCRAKLKVGGKLIRTFSPSGKSAQNASIFGSRTGSDCLDLAALDQLKHLIEDDHLQPVVDSEYHFVDYIAAFHKTASNSTVGKAVLTFRAKRQQQFFYK